ncbi:MAG: LysM peptidoglycan-binding domain-containing protein, partial [Deltaproteobacteria bacterium]|nr:LysM peptidoglycan-binding domain-containing protein [Deltaproteobacteria bacterium]
MEQFMTGGPLSGICSSLIACRKVVALLMVGAILISCSGYSVRDSRPRGVYHRVKSGETLSAIAKAYQIKLQDLAEINNISKPDQIEADSVIFIPDATQVIDDVGIAAQTKVAAGEKAAAPPVAAAKEAAPPVIPRKEPPKKETVSEPAKRPEKAPVDVTKKERTAPSREKDRDRPAPKVSAKPEGEGTADPPVKKK